MPARAVALIGDLAERARFQDRVPPRSTLVWRLRANCLKPGRQLRPRSRGTVRAGMTSWRLNDALIAGAVALADRADVACLRRSRQAGQIEGRPRARPRARIASSGGQSPPANPRTVVVLTGGAASNAVGLYVVPALVSGYLTGFGRREAAMLDVLTGAVNPVGTPRRNMRALLGTTRPYPATEARCPLPRGPPLSVTATSRPRASPSQLRLRPVVLELRILRPRREREGAGLTIINTSCTRRCRGRQLVSAPGGVFGPPASSKGFAQVEVAAGHRPA